jgi:hypothetical protein
MLAGMNKPPVLVLAFALFAVACAPAATNAPAATSPAETSAAGTAPASAAASASIQPPAVTAAPPSAGPSTGATVDYTGEFSGGHVAGTLKYCGATAHPYWAADLVSSSGDRAFMSYIIPAGTTSAVAGVMDTPFLVSDWNDAAAGTGQFVAGDPAHFILVNQEGTYDITLKAGKFCNTQ